jgi:hypothetical protein
MKKTDFILVKDVEKVGVGNVERNFVDNIMTLKQEKNYQPQKTIILPCAVSKKKDLEKICIVVEDVQAIVQNDGPKDW